MIRVAGAEHTDQQMSEPPGDGRDRGWIGRWKGEVDGEVARPRLHGSGGAPTGMHVPAAGHRLGEVLLVGEAVESAAQVRLPVPFELVDQ